MPPALHHLQTFLKILLGLLSLLLSQFTPYNNAAPKTPEIYGCGDVKENNECHLRQRRTTRTRRRKRRTAARHAIHAAPPTAAYDSHMEIDLASEWENESRASAGVESQVDGRPRGRRGRRDDRNPNEHRRRRSSSTDSVPGTIINVNFDAKHLWRVHGELNDERLTECRQPLFLSTFLRRTDTSWDHTGWASESSRKNHTVIVLAGEGEEERFADDMKRCYEQLGGAKRNKKMTSEEEYPVLQFHRFGARLEETFDCVSQSEGKVMVAVDKRHDNRVDPFINHLDGKGTMAMQRNFREFGKSKCKLL